MTQIARDIVDTNDVTYFQGDAYCGGSLINTEIYFRREAYYDDEYLSKMVNGLPFLMMPFRLIRRTKQYNLAQARNAPSYMLHSKTCFGDIPTFGLEPLVQADSRDLALLDFYSNIENPDHLNLGLALLESKKTLNLVSRTAIGLARSFRDLRRGRFNDVFRRLRLNDDVPLKANTFGNGHHLRSVGDHRRYMYEHRMQERFKPGFDPLQFAASKWLELQYGWKPLVSDVSNALKFNFDRLNNNHDDIIVKGYGRSILEDNSQDSNVECTCTAIGTTKLTVSLKVIDESKRTYDSLGLSNPLSLAWELLPFSFVADWFLPIGSWANSLTALSGYSVQQKSRQTAIDVSAQKWSVVNHPLIVVGQRTLGSLSSFDLERTIDFSLSHPNPLLNLGPKLNVRRLTSALSLLKVVFL